MLFRSALEARWTPEPSPGRRGEVWRWPHSGLKQRALHRLAADRAAAVAPGEFLFGGVADVGVAIVGEALDHVLVALAPVLAAIVAAAHARQPPGLRPGEGRLGKGWARKGKHR